MKVAQLNNTSLQITQKFLCNEKSTVSQLKNNQSSFEAVLNNTVEKENKLQFSKHAAQRLKLRDINFTENQLERIETGVTKAKQKGIKDSLVLIDNITLVVNTKNNIVITAMERTNESENIYTNIDGAVIV